MPRCHRILAFFLAILLLPISGSGASEGPPPILHPKTYASPSGEYQLHVDPSTPLGEGEGAYRLTRKGEEVWTARHPFTFWEATVTDEGVVAGYAYTSGWRGFSRQGDAEFVVAILDPAGAFRLREAVPRKQSQYLHTPPNPLGSGLFVHPELDRFVVRVKDEDLNRQQEHWWVHRLSDGKALERIAPKAQMDVPPDGTWIFDAQPVRGTPLTLVHWHLLTGEFPTSEMGASFTLVDPQGRPVWRHDLQGDYEMPGADDHSRWQLRERVARHGAILAAGEPNRFEVWFAKDKQRVAFAVKPPAAQDGKWSVEEVGRQPYDGPPEPAAAHYEPIELEHLGTIQLSAVDDAKAPIRDVREFDIDDRGRIGFIRLDNAAAKEQRSTFVLVEPNAEGGKVLLEVSPEGFGVKDWWQEQVAWLGRDEWLVTSTPLDEKLKARAWRVDTEKGIVREMEGFAAPGIVALAGMGDGKFAGLVQEDSAFTSAEWLAAFDNDGRSKWTIPSEHGNPQALFSPEDVTVTTDGQVAVIDNIAHDVKLFDRDGKHLRTIELEKVFGRAPNYPVGVAADADGGIIVHDFDGSPPLWRITQDGKLRSKFQPRYPDGRTFRLSGSARHAPDGRIWTSDGEGLLRLNDDGVVDLVLGRPPNPEALDQIAGITVDHHGRIYAVEARTGAVHVFAPDGKPLHVCIPAPEDFGDSLSLADITVDGEGNVYVGGSLDRQYVRFDAAGKRTGRVSLEIDDISCEWNFKPEGGERWVAGYEQVYLVGADEKVKRTIQRRPDRNWLGRSSEIAVARDGSLAVSTWPFGHGDDSAEPGVHLYSPDGEPIRSIAGPTGFTLAHAGRYVIVSFNADIYLYPADGGPIRKFTPPTPDGGQDYWYPLISADGSELLLHAAGTRQVERYKLPE